MRKVTQLGILALTLIFATGLIGASSFTTATLTRDTNINVVSDSNGVIGLEDKLTGDVIKEDASTGELKIDFTVGTASGVNVDSKYELGDPNNPATTPGFNITNNDAASHTIQLNYTFTGTTSGVIGDGSNSTEFQVYDSNGVKVLTISEEDNGDSFTLASGDSAAVVVIVDTTPANVDKNDDLSGNLEVTAT